MSHGRHTVPRDKDLENENLDSKVVSDGKGRRSLWQISMGTDRNKSCWPTIIEI